MAYRHSTFGGTLGHHFRIWVDAIRTHNGSAADNSEDWKVEGGLDRLSPNGGAAPYNGYNQANFTLRLGLNGVTRSEHFSYALNQNVGRQLAWHAGPTKVHRNSAGVGYQFTSRFDLNMANSPYLTSGWVDVVSSLDTKLRHADLTALSMHAGNIPATDEGPMWLEFSNPSGTGVRAILEAPPGGAGRIFTSGNVGSRYNFPWSQSLTEKFQQAYPNSKTGTVRIGIYDTITGSAHYDTRDVGFTIKNDVGQAEPIFSNFEFGDTNPVTLAITGDPHVLIQFKSTLETTVPLADKATPRKFATMSSYSVTLGPNTTSMTYSDVADATVAIPGTSYADTLGDKTISVRAIDSRGYSTTVTKPVTILPYTGPGFFYALNVRYTNEFDNSDGLTASGYDTNGIAVVSPMTLNGTDLNQVDPVSGVQVQISKGQDPWIDDWADVAITQDAGTGIVRMDPTSLATTINNKMNAWVGGDGITGADNTQPWYLWFKITDALETHNYVAVIDIGRPILRIGADSDLYHKEVEFSQAFNSTPNVWLPGYMGEPFTGSWGPSAKTGLLRSSSVFSNAATKATGDMVLYRTHLAKGTYDMIMCFWRDAESPNIRCYFDGFTLFEYNLQNLPTTPTGEQLLSLGGLEVDESGEHTFHFQVLAPNPSGIRFHMQVVAIQLIKW